MRDFLNKYTAVQKRNMLLTALFLIVAFAVTIWATTRPHYVTIMAGLDEKSLGQVQNELQTLKIPDQINGTSVLVPASQANNARAQLAVAGLPNSGYFGYDKVSTSPIGTTDQVFNLQVLNALQDNLDITIESMNGVENAQVYIVQPQQDLFVTQQPTGAKASVFVQVGQGTQLSSAEVSGIQTLVAHSVTGMQPSDVAVVDQNGVTLSNANDTTGTVAGSSSELALRQNLESSLQQTISDELNQIVGYGNAVVAVNYNVSFNQVKSQSTKYLPAPGSQTGLVSNVQKSSQTTSNGGSSAGGVAGQSSSNPGLPTYQGTGSGSGGSSQSTSSTTSYNNGVQQQQVVGDPMQIKGVDVSVLLNAKSANVTKAVETQIRQFVSGAAGAAAGAAATNISVSSVPFQPTLVGNAPSAVGFKIPTWSYAVGAAAVVGLVLFFMRRRQRPKESPAANHRVVDMPAFPEDELDLMGPTEDEHMRDQLVNLANQRPDEFANLLRTWLVGE